MFLFVGTSVYAQILYSEENPFPKIDVVSKNNKSGLVPFTFFPNETGNELSKNLETSSLDNMPILLPPSNIIEKSVLLSSSDKMPNPLFKAISPKD